MLARWRRVGLAAAVLLGGVAAREEQAPSEPDQFGTCPNISLELLDPAVKKQLEGANGTFVDQCDENGNLIEYGCILIWGTDSYGAPFVYHGDEVVPDTIDCGGECDDGRCPSD